MSPTSAESPCAAAQWFGPAFDTLHPALQQVHRHGGHLHGPVTVTLGRGLAGWVGARLARRLGVPLPHPANTLTVHIASDAAGLHWNRCFNGRTVFHSRFTPTGTYPSGQWIERSGALRLGLSVDVIDQAWHWRTRRAWLGPVRLPLWLLPRTVAGKAFSDGRYRFFVRVSLPMLGDVLGYAGSLEAVTNDTGLGLEQRPDSPYHAG